MQALIDSETATHPHLANHSEPEEHEEEEEGIQLAKIMISTVEGPLTITIFLLFVTIVKAIYYKLEKLQTFVPESCILIFCGLILGCVLYFGWPSQIVKLQLTTETLFLIILPPIMLESAYSLHDRMFFENIGSILLFAVIGTFLAFVSIGLSCWGMSEAGVLGMQLDVLPSLLFSSFIVAVDPVAVLAIFQDIGVDRRLYLLVFGESLLNDGVTVVLYNVMKELSGMSSIDAGDAFMGVASFFTVACGGLVIGIFVGGLSAFTLRFMSHVRVMEICILLMMAYLSYVFAMLFDWSGIISIVACGLMQVQYGFPNMHEKSRTSAKYVAKMLALLFESLIFMYLGLELLTNLIFTTEWNTGFALWSLFYCLLSRFAITFLLSFFLNWSNRLNKISFMEQIIMAYGGLRGAIAFALVTTLDESLLLKLGVKRGVFISTTLFIIIFTTVFMGLLTKPFVKLLRIRLEQEKVPNLIEEFHLHLQDHVKYGIESITGRTGRSYWRQVIGTVDDYFVKPVLQRQPETRSQEMVKRFQKVAEKLPPTPAHAMHELDIYHRSAVTDAHEHASVVEKPRITVETIEIESDSSDTFVDLSGLASASADLRKRSRDFGKLHMLMQEHAPSGVQRERFRRSCVEEDAPYLKELKKKRRIVYALYNMQKKTMRRKQLQPSFMDSAPVAKPTTAMQRLARQVTSENLQKAEKQQSLEFHTLPRKPKTSSVQFVTRSQTLDRPRRRNGTVEPHRASAIMERPSDGGIEFSDLNRDSIDFVAKPKFDEEERQSRSVESSEGEDVGQDSQDAENQNSNSSSRSTSNAFNNSSFEAEGDAMTSDL